MSNDLINKITQARRASLLLAQLPRGAKDRALRAASEFILENRSSLIEANFKDLEEAKKLMDSGQLSRPLLDRLKLDAPKTEAIAKMVASVSELEDPVGRTVYSTKMDEGLDLYKVTVPFGVIATIFESRPDALPQVASLCIKSGNSVLLKGGSEAKESNRAMFKLLEEVFTREGLPAGCIQLVEGREAVASLLRMDGMVDLIIPRGSNEFVKYIQDNTRIPVLGHSSGICHIFVDRMADPDKAVSICHDARVQYPAACNSMKILLVDAGAPPDLLPRIADRLIRSGVRILGCPAAVAALRSSGLPVAPAAERDWSTEHLDLTLPVKVVDGVGSAVDHINKYGSRHTDSIITEDATAAKAFLTMVDSSTVMQNASPRFSDGYRYGLGAEVGISTNKIHARGPVGLEGLVTWKYFLIGSGQKVSDYIGNGARPFLHGRADRTLRERLSI